MDVVFSQHSALGWFGFAVWFSGAGKPGRRPGATGCLPRRHHVEKFALKRAVGRKQIRRGLARNSRKRGHTEVVGSTNSDDAFG